MSENRRHWLIIWSVVIGLLVAVTIYWAVSGPSDEAPPGEVQRVELIER